MSNDSDDYEVGYRKPPKHTRFKPGQSGNPKGRPKKSKNLETLIQQELDTPITVKEGGREKRLTKRQAIAIRLVNGALAGEPRQLEFLFKQAQKSAMPDPFVVTGEDEAELRKALDYHIEKGWKKGNQYGDES